MFPPHSVARVTHPCSTTPKLLLLGGVDNEKIRLIPAGQKKGILTRAKFVLLVAVLMSISQTLFAQQGILVTYAQTGQAAVQGAVLHKPTDSSSQQVTLNFSSFGIPSSCTVIYVTLVVSFTDSHNTHGGGTFFSTNFSYGGDGYVDPINIGDEGGSVNVQYQIGSQTAPMQTLTFQIVGTNPTTQQVDTYSQQQDANWYWSQVLQQESGYQQYLSSGLPKISPNPDGVGIAQTDGHVNDIPDGAYWDWSANISFGLGIDEQNSSTAGRIWTNYLSQWINDYPCGNNGPPPSNKGNGCFFAYPAAQNPGAHFYQDANNITGYNGVGGNGTYPPHYYIFYTPTTPRIQGAWTVQQGVRTYVQDVCSRPPI